MKFTLVVLPGDGIGPEVVSEVVKVLKAVGQRFDHEFDLNYGLIGGMAIDKEGTALSADTLQNVPEERRSAAGCSGRPQSMITPKRRLTLRMGFWLYVASWVGRQSPVRSKSIPLLSTTPTSSLG